MQHVKLRSYTHMIRIVTYITDRYVKLVRSVRRIRVCQCDYTLTTNSGYLHHIVAFYTQESVTNAYLKVHVRV